VRHDGREEARATLLLGRPAGWAAGKAGHATMEIRPTWAAAGAGAGLLGPKAEKGKEWIKFLFYFS